MHTKEKVSSSDCQRFYKFLVQQIPRYDAQILADMELPKYDYAGTVLTGIADPDWWLCREAVRRLSEGVRFKPSRRLSQKSPWEAQLDWDRGRVFKSWPPYESHGWIPAAAGCVGEPCDAT